VPSAVNSCANAPATPLPTARAKLILPPRNLATVSCGSAPRPPLTAVVMCSSIAIPLADSISPINLSTPAPPATPARAVITLLGFRELNIFARDVNGLFSCDDNFKVGFRSFIICSRSLSYSGVPLVRPRVCSLN